MSSEDLADRVRQIMQIIEEIRSNTGSPGLQCALHDMEISCHMALNYLGETDAIAPEVLS